MFGYYLSLQIKKKRQFIGKLRFLVSDNIFIFYGYKNI